jgi:thioredoxin 1
MYQRKSVSSSFLSLYLTLFYTENMVVKPINSYQEFKDIIEQDKLVVLCFWAEWSAPCRLISPLFELHSDIHKGADFYKVDADAQEVSIQKSF